MFLKVVSHLLIHSHPVSRAIMLFLWIKNLRLREVRSVIEKPDLIESKSPVPCSFSKLYSYKNASIFIHKRTKECSHIE